MGDKAVDDRDKRRRVKQRGGEQADWATANPQLVVHAIAAAARAGAALRFGYSRDGGAYAIGVYDGDDKYTLWVKPGEPAELDITLQDIIDGFDDEPTAPHTKPKKAPKND